MSVYLTTTERCEYRDGLEERKHTVVVLPVRIDDQDQSYDKRKAKTPPRYMLNGFSMEGV